MLRLEGPSLIEHPGSYEDFVARIVEEEGIYVDGLQGRYAAQLMLYRYSQEYYRNSE